MIDQYVYPELVWVHKLFPNKEDLFKTVARNLYNNGFVNEQYSESLISREIKFPTGLALEDYFVAIPHSDCKNVKKSFVSVVILDKPVIMNKMDDPEMEIPVEYVFFFRYEQ
ncbi:PTS sugar transporter subunit IIA [Propionispira raffinosivorans]|uniref:PTS sugar transporter subunit IIA n=1 Tax=Propionispira raffinosivorans TaxID=86959 RepID=UPI00036F07E9|nr:PTS sugar transporter subunit IIA [Propionispira raffinosivorans]